MQAALVADEVLIQLGENVEMYIGTRAKPNIRVNLSEMLSMYTIDSYVCPHVFIQRSHGIPCNSHKYKYIYMHLYKKKNHKHTYVVYLII
jgi:hypothetical protein